MAAEGVAIDRDQKDLLESLNNALANFVSDDKAAYGEALERCPDLVLQESNPASFLRCEGNDDFFATGIRISSYWKSRKDIFGEEMAFLPLSLDGHGALDAEAIAALQTGYMAVLPKDKHGHPVICLDIARVEDRFSDEAILRSSFYIFEMCSQSIKGQLDGFVCLLVPNPALGRMSSRLVFRQILDGSDMFPMRRKTIYLPGVERTPELRAISQQTMDNLSKNKISFHSVNNESAPLRITPVIGRSDNDLLKKLQHIGISPNAVPQCFAGSWDETIFYRQILDAQLLPSFAFLSDGNKQDPSPKPSDDDGAPEVFRESIITEEDVQMIQEVIVNMQNTERIAYLEASTQAPNLVKHESPYDKFLRFVDGDTYAAARRLTSYWSIRKSIFGSRAFLPMSQTGRGAIAPLEIPLLRSGYLAVLPNDGFGRSVLVVDRSRLPVDSSPEAILRCMFYIFQIMTQNDKTQSLGFVCLVAEKSQGKDRPFDLIEFQAGKDIFESAMPIRCAEIHVLSQCASRGDFFTTQLLEFVLRKSATLHETSPASMVKLQAFGLSSACIPQELGGGMKPDEVVSWHEERVQLEWQITEKLTNERKACVDKTGNHVGVVAVEVCHQGSAVDDFYEALGGISEEEKLDLLLAQELVPELVESESPAIRFLRTEDYNAAAAANRLVSYWRKRRILFGERAYLPMNTTGKGALCPEDCERMECGLLTMLPNDRGGHNVIVVDRHRAADLPDHEENRWRNRIAFYMFHLASENPLSQNHGIIVLYNFLGMINVTKRKGEFARMLIKEAMPIRLLRVRILVINGSDGNLRLIVSWLLKTITATLKSTIAIHAASTRSEMYNILQKSGIPHIPVGLGGCWRYDVDFPVWLEQRKRVEMAYQQRFTQHHDILGLLSQCFDRLRARLDEKLNFCQRPANDVFADAIDLQRDEAKLAYLEAKEHAQELLKTESTMELFLLAEHKNPWAAASRLTRYWMERKNIFKGRAFLRMDQTGEGTLCADDIQLLRTGYCALLPQDNQGRPVMCIDGSLGGCKLSPRKNHVSFYMGCVFAENAKECDGGTVLVIQRGASGVAVEPPLLRLAQDTLPLRINTIHVVNFTSQAARLKSNESPAEERVHDSGSTVPRLIMHTVKSNKDAMKQLQRYGFSKRTLPESIGGTWTYARFERWRETRVRLEWGLPQKKEDQPFADAGPQAKHWTKLTEEERIERKRRQSLVCSRRTRERKRNKEALLTQQLYSLKESNASLSRDNNRLEDLIKEANLVIQNEMDCDILEVRGPSRSGGPLTNQISGTPRQKCVTLSEYPRSQPSIRAEQGEASLQTPASPFDLAQSLRATHVPGTSGALQSTTRTHLDSFPATIDPAASRSGVTRIVGSDVSVQNVNEQELAFQQALLQQQTMPPSYFQQPTAMNPAMPLGWINANNLAPGAFYANPFLFAQQRQLGDPPFAGLPSASPFSIAQQPRRWSGSAGGLPLSPSLLTTLLGSNYAGPPANNSGEGASRCDWNRPEQR